MRSERDKREEVSSRFVWILFWVQLCLIAMTFTLRFHTQGETLHALVCGIVLAFCITRHTRAHLAWKAALVENFPKDPFARYPFWATLFCLLRRKDPDRILGPKYRPKK